MKTKWLNDNPKTLVIVFDSGDEALAGLRRVAQEQQLAAANFTAIGAFSEVMLGFFSFEKGDYKRIPLHEQVEVLSLIGGVTLAEGETQVHAHIVVGKSDGTAHGGHLLSGIVRPTLEVILVESPAHLIRKRDAATGLLLIDLDKE